MKELFILLILAFALRLAAFGVAGIFYENESFLNQPSGAPHQFYETSQNLEVSKEAEEDVRQSEWWQHAPVYILWLYITNQSILIQILLSSLTVVIFYLINRKLGIFFLLYPVHIVLSYCYVKETVMIFVIAAVIYSLRDYPVWLFISVMLTYLSFGASGGPFDVRVIVLYGTEVTSGPMLNFWQIWKPSFFPLGIYSASYLLIIPYIYLMIKYVKKLRFTVNTAIICTVTLILIFIQGQERYREPLMPFILLDILEAE